MEKTVDKDGKTRINYTRDEWVAEGKRLFGGEVNGTDVLRWRFKCPKCGNIATGQDFKDAGCKSADVIYTHCIGRYVEGKGCDWAATGLFDICNVHVDGQPVFEFAPYSDAEKAAMAAKAEGV